MNTNYYDCDSDSDRLHAIILWAYVILLPKNYLSLKLWQDEYIATACTSRYIRDAQNDVYY